MNSTSTINETTTCTQRFNNQEPTMWHYVYQGDNKPICGEKIYKGAHIDSPDSIGRNDFICPMCQLERENIEHTGRIYGLSLEASVMIEFFSSLSNICNKNIFNLYEWEQIRAGNQSITNFCNISEYLNIKPSDCVSIYEKFRNSYIAKYSNNQN